MFVVLIDPATGTENKIDNVTGVSINGNVLTFSDPTAKTKTQTTLPFKVVEAEVEPELEY